MDKDKFKKLVRLANNNPNDNEANVAARMACRMIAEDNFAGLLGPSTAKTYNDIKRESKPQWSSKPPQTDWSGFGRGYYNTYEAQEDFFRQWSQREDPFYEAYKKSKQQPPDPRIQYTCVRCKCNAWAYKNDDRYSKALCRMCYEMVVDVHYDTARVKYVCSSCGHSMLKPIYETILNKVGRCPKCRVRWKKDLL